MWQGYFAITVAFVIIAVLLLICITRSNVNIWIKLTLIPVVLWFSLALYYLPGNIMGWPVKMQEIPDRIYIIQILVQEPTSKDKGAIYLWGIKDPEITSKKISFLSPKAASKIDLKGVPKSYQLLYSETIHKKVLKARKKQRENPGSLIITAKKKGKINNNEIIDNIRFKILKIEELLGKN